MKYTTLFVIPVLASVCNALAQVNAVPSKIPFQGSVSANGQPFTGTGYFKFALVVKDPAAAEQFTWTNDSANPKTSEPASSEQIQVVGGHYNVLLGGEEPEMPDISPRDLNGKTRFLRVWFSTTDNGFQQLQPDFPLGSAPYSLVAQTVIGDECEIGPRGTALGYRTTASGQFSTAMGRLSTASGSESTAIGSGSVANGIASTAIGVSSVASGFSSIAIGADTMASGSRSTAMGGDTVASGSDSIAIGTGTLAISAEEVALGSYNTSYTPLSDFVPQPRDRQFVIGNGNFFDRSDALIIKKNGQSIFIADPGATNGNLLSDYASVIENTDATAGSDVLALKVAATDPNSGSNYLAFFAGQNDTVVGEIDGNGNGGVRFQSNGADYAEYLLPLDPVETLAAGDVVAVRSGKITRDTSSFDQLMVISTNPIIIGNRPKDLPEDESGYHKVAFIGQVPVKVSGPVSSGDYLLASGGNDGSAVAKAASELRASDTAFIIGRAWDSSVEPGEKLVNAAVGLDHGPALVAEVNRLKKRLDVVENFINSRKGFVTSR